MIKMLSKVSQIKILKKRHWECKENCLESLSRTTEFRKTLYISLEAEVLQFCC